MNYSTHPSPEAWRIVTSSVVDNTRFSPAASASTHHLAVLLPANGRSYGAHFQLRPHGAVLLLFLAKPLRSNECVNGHATTTARFRLRFIRCFVVLPRDCLTASTRTFLRLPSFGRPGGERCLWCKRIQSIKYHIAAIREEQPPHLVSLLELLICQGCSRSTRSLRSLHIDATSSEPGDFAVWKYGSKDKHA